MQLSKRMNTVEPYFFAKLGTHIAKLKAQGKDIIRLDMGSPDLPPAQFIVDTLHQLSSEANLHGYAPLGGSPDFLKAVSTYYANRFDVNLDPTSEIVGLIGSKEGLFHLSMAFLNPDDIVLVPDPGYAVYARAAKFAGAKVVTMPLLESNHFLPDLSSIPNHIASRTKLLWLNYPNNPTGAIVDDKFFTEVVEFAHTHQIMICNDAPYMDITFDGYNAPSLLQVSGSSEVAIEFNSLSKTYNMAGWRLGMACGNQTGITALRDLKSNVDSSQFQAIQASGVAALTGDQTWLKERNTIYQERRNIVLDGLSNTNLIPYKPQAAMYVWVRIQDNITSKDFTETLLEEVGVSVTPGSFFGESGEGYFRISLGTPTDRIQEAIQRIADWK